MVEKLKVKAIYDDFVSNINLTEEQIRILDMYIKKESTVKIALEIGVSTRTITYEIKKLKQLYQDYVFMQTWKAILLM